MAPPAPLTTIQWEKLGMSVTDSVNGHVETTFSLSSHSWSTPNFIKDPYIRIHGLAPALNYGMQCYEGIKAVRTASNTITIFRPDFHAKRMAHSAQVVSMPPVPESLFLSCLTQVVQQNAEFVGPSTTGSVLYIRPILFGSGPQIALEPPSTFTFAIFVVPATNYHGTQPLNCVVMENFDRAATRGTGHAKIGGNYAPAIRHQKAAKEAGFYMTLHLDSATMSEVDEFSTSGFVGIKHAKHGVGHPTIVVPDSKNVIASVTSDSICQLALAAGWTVEKRRVPYADLGTFDEVLAVGTAASVLPIASIVRTSMGNKFVYCPTGEAGPVGLQMRKMIQEVMRGERKDEFGWVYEVPFPEENRVKLKVDAVVNGNGIVSRNEVTLASVATTVR